MISLLRRYSLYWPLFLIILLGLYNAYGNAFMQDDAYISYNYAKWFSRGYGLVWYPNSTEFGYTNFFYTLIIGIAMLFRVPPEIASNSINIASFVGCLIVSYKIAERVLVSRLFALLFVVLLATHHTFTAYATGGLETMWVTLLVLAFYWHILVHGEREPKKNYLVIGTLAALALLSRLDTALLLFPGYCYLLLGMRGGVRGYYAWFLEMQSAILIPALTTLGFLLACFIAYGYALPNTFYVKMMSGESMFKSGLRYLWLYNIWQFYVPLLVPLVMMYFLAKRDFLFQLGAETLLFASIMLGWLGYIVCVGGDFMEFRFLVPVLPFYYVVTLRLARVLLPQRCNHLVIGVTCLLLLGNYSHSVSRISLNPEVNLQNLLLNGVNSTEALHSNITEKPNNWITVGQKLHALFYTGNVTDVKIAVSAAGVIPYFSSLLAIDEYGLNSRSILENGEYFTSIPGHRLRISSSYMKAAGVNLVIDHPMYFPSIMRCGFMPNFAAHRSIRGVATVYIPINAGQYLLAYYLNPHSAIEKALADKKIFYCK